MSNQLQLTNIINVSVIPEAAGASEYNTSNLALFTSEVYGSTFGTLGYKIYVDPTDVATDFGTGSETYAMALSVFSQKPNILAGGGSLIVIPIVPQIQDFALSAVAASGTFVLNFGGHASAAINWNDTAAQIQTKLRAVTGLTGVSVTGSIASKDLKIEMNGYYGDQSLMTVSANSLEDSGMAGITFTITTGTAAETYAAAITRTKDLVQYFGLMGVMIFDQADMLAAAAVIQALNKIGGFVSRTSADVAPGGMLDLLRTGGFTQSRGLFYGGASDNSALGMMAAYFGRGLSVDFSGSNTTLTMNLKDLAGVDPDPSMNQTLYDQCKVAGADVYVSFAGVSKVASFGANSYFDQIYNALWFAGALQIAGFNALAQSQTKVPQTEAGVAILKSAYRQVCEQGVTNQYGAPGTWTSPSSFGNLQDLLANITQRGYYIYSQPISQQLPTDRSARKAPLIQIAFKEAGAIHSSNVIVNVNA